MSTVDKKLLEMIESTITYLGFQTDGNGHIFSEWRDENGGEIPFKVIDDGKNMFLALPNVADKEKYHIFQPFSNDHFNGPTITMNIISRRLSLRINMMLQILGGMLLQLAGDSDAQRSLTDDQLQVLGKLGAVNNTTCRLFEKIWPDNAESLQSLFITTAFKRDYRLEGNRYSTGLQISCPAYTILEDNGTNINGVDIPVSQVHPIKRLLTTLLPGLEGGEYAYGFKFILAGQVLTYMAGVLPIMRHLDTLIQLFRPHVGAYLFGENAGLIDEHKMFQFDYRWEKLISNPGDYEDVIKNSTHIGTTNSVPTKVAEPYAAIMNATNSNPYVPATPKSASYVNQAVATQAAPVAIQAPAPVAPVQQQVMPVQQTTQQVMQPQVPSLPNGVMTVEMFNQLHNTPQNQMLNYQMMNPMQPMIPQQQLTQQQWLQQQMYQNQLLQNQMYQNSMYQNQMMMPQPAVQTTGQRPLVISPAMLR